MFLFIDYMSYNCLFQQEARGVREDWTVQHFSESDEKKNSREQRNTTICGLGCSCCVSKKQKKLCAFLFLSIFLSFNLLLLLFCHQRSETN